MQLDNWYKSQRLWSSDADLAERLPRILRNVDKHLPVDTDSGHGLTWSAQARTAVQPRHMHTEATSSTVLHWNTHKQNSPKTRYKLQMNGCTRQRLSPECLMTKINRNLVVVPDKALGRPETVFQHDAPAVHEGWIGTNRSWFQTNTSMDIPAVRIITPCKLVYNSDVSENPRSTSH